MPTAPLTELQPVVVLQVGSVHLALPTSQVCGVVTVDHVAPVPLAPKALAGVAVLSGEPAAVVDLASIVGQKSIRNPSQTALLCDVAGTRVALVGGRLKRVGRLRRCHLRAASPLGRQGVEYRGTAITLIEPGYLMAATGAKALPKEKGASHVQKQRHHSELKG